MISSVRNTFCFRAVWSLAISICFILLSASQPAPADEVKAPPPTINDADESLIRGKYKDAEEGYRALLDDDETGDAFAGLAVSLAKQAWPSKVLEAERVLKQARDK